MRAARSWIDAAGIADGALFRSLTPHRRVQALPIAGRDVANLVQRLGAAHGSTAISAATVYAPAS